MLEFNLSLLRGFASLFGSPPMIYLFGFVLFAVIVKVFLGFCGLANMNERR